MWIDSILEIEQTILNIFHIESPIWMVNMIIGAAIFFFFAIQLGIENAKSIPSYRYTTSNHRNIYDENDYDEDYWQAGKDFQDGVTASKWETRQRIKIQRDRENYGRTVAENVFGVPRKRR